MRASAGSPALQMFARMFMLKAMNHGVERGFNPNAKTPHLGQEKTEA